MTLRLTPAGARLHARAVQRTAPVFERFAERLEGEDLAAACAALAACLRGTDLAEVVSRRLADTAETASSGGSVGSAVDVDAFADVQP